jgi:hypothetical protein
MTIVTYDPSKVKRDAEALSGVAGGEISELGESFATFSK